MLDVHDFRDNTFNTYSHVSGVTELSEVTRVFYGCGSTTATRFLSRNINTSGFEHSVKHTGIDDLS